MKFDLGNITQGSQWIRSQLLIPYYEHCRRLSPKCIRFSAPLISMGDALISSSETITALAEISLKGSINVCQGAIYRDRNILKMGLLQLALGNGSILLLSIPIIFCRTLRIAISCADDPIPTIADLLEKARVTEENDLLDKEYREYQA